MTHRSQRFFSLLMGLLVTIPPAVIYLEAQSSVEVDAGSGLISVESKGVPLDLLLKQINAVTPFKLLRLEPAIHARPVEISIDGASVRRAVIQILKTAEVGFVIFGPENGQGLRVVAGGTEFVAQTARSSEAPLEIFDAGHIEASAFRQSKTEDVESENPGSPDLTGPKDDARRANERHQQLVRALVGNGVVMRPQGTVLLPVPGPGGGYVTSFAAPAGSVIELPFPGVSGARLTTVVPPPGQPVQLPFPPSPPPR